MKITIAMGAFFPMPPAPCGAVEYVWHGLAEQFAKRGHEVMVLCRWHPSQGRNETINGVRYVRRTEFSRGRTLRGDLLKDLAYSASWVPRLPRADVLVTNVFFLPAMVPLLRRGRGALVVNMQRMPKGQVWLYGGASRLTVVSGAVKEAVAAERPSALGRVRVIPNPIDTETFVPPAGGRPARGTRTILYTGRVHPEKGLDLLVGAFREASETRPGLRLRLVGPQRVSSGGGGEEYVAGLMRLAQGAAVEICDPIYGRAALAAELQSADVYCYPSVAERGETFGVAPLEAMGTGLPTVVSDLACFRDFVEPGVNGVVFDHRATDASRRLAAALGGILDDPAGAARMGARASSTAGRFSYAAVAAQYLADFGALCGTSERSVERAGATAS